MIIYFVIIALYLFLLLGIWMKQFSIASLASIGLIVLGVYSIIYGISDISNIFTYAFGTINIGIGAYVFLKGTTELIERYYNY